MENSLICSVCKERMAVVFITKIVNNQQVQEGLCLVCAKKMNIQPVNQFLSQAGITEEDLENLNEEMSNVFENGNFEELLGEGGANFLMPMRPNSDINNEGNNETEKHSELSKGFITPQGSPAGDKKDKPKKLKFLEQYGINLNKLAYDGKLDNIIGRDNEINRVIQILNRRTKNNPVLLGEPGVGKTAIAEGLAVRILQQNVPVKLMDKQIYQLDLTAMIAGTQFRGQFETRMKGVIDEVKNSGNIILVIDELHNIMGAGEAEGAMNAANILKPALAKGNVQVIGATTLNEYRKYIEKDSALERRFQPVIVDEPSVRDTVEILKGIRRYYESFHNVIIPDDVVETAANLSERYITDRYLPDKAIDVIDEAASKQNLSNDALNEIEKLNNELFENKQEQDTLAAKATEESYKKIAELKTREIQIGERLQFLSENMDTTLTVEDIAEVIEQWTKIPVKTVSETEAVKLINLESRIHERVIGQNEAVSSVCRAIRRSRSGFRKKRKPASFIFVGPTGVGKTELVKSLAIELFGNEDALIRLDMSEYMEKHTTSRMVGAPPGYVGYDEGGQFTEKVRRKPYSVILLDEIEKAHSDVFNMLLQILDDGRLTDGHGRVVNFENTIIVMTSNAGTSIKSGSIGFASDSSKAAKDKIMDSLKEIFRPEFLNRVDDIVVFDPLKKEQLSNIADIMLNEVLSEAMEKNISFAVSAEAKEFLISKGFDDKNGARPLRRTIQRYVEDELSERYLCGSLNAGTTVSIDINDNKDGLKFTEKKSVRRKR